MARLARRVGCTSAPGSSCCAQPRLLAGIMRKVEVAGKRIGERLSPKKPKKVRSDSRDEHEEVLSVARAVVPSSVRMHTGSVVRACVGDSGTADLNARLASAPGDDGGGDGGGAGGDDGGGGDGGGGGWWFKAMAPKGSGLPGGSRNSVRAHPRCAVRALL